LFLIIVKVLGYPKGVYREVNFLHGGGMDVFWNDLIELTCSQIESGVSNDKLINEAKAECLRKLE
jgi:hypothetical protein